MNLNWEVNEYSMRTKDGQSRQWQRKAVIWQKIRCVKLSPTYTISCCAVSDLRNLKKSKKKDIIFFKCAPVFYCGSEPPDEGDGRTMMGDNADGEVVMLRPIRPHCAEVWISAGLYDVNRYICKWLDVWWALPCPRPFRRKPFLKSGSAYVYMHIRNL